MDRRNRLIEALKTGVLKTDTGTRHADPKIMQIIDIGKARNAHRAQHKISREEFSKRLKNLIKKQG